ncbi:winged helix-turn-helix domain-containing protein (plasmid) [Bradyrhizobium japonicum]|nr:winged helix-turn-helix domain-containing protein [Bradyrhizobium japonicum]
MGGTVAIGRFDLTAPELWKAAQREKDRTAARRMLALALVLEAGGAGRRRKTAEWIASPCGTGGIGTTWKAWPGFGRAIRLILSPKLTAQRKTNWQACRSRRRSGAGVVRWRRIDLRDGIERRFGVTMHERSVGKILAKLGYRRFSVRPALSPSRRRGSAGIQRVYRNRCGSSPPSRPK